MSPILMVVPDTGATFTATVVIAGISVVVGVLLLLILVFNLFGIIVPRIEKLSKTREAKKADKKAKKAEKKKENPEITQKAKEKTADDVTLTKKPKAPRPAVENGISEEVVAAITAAIAASEGTSVTVRSIKKKNVSGRNPWAQAANIDNTRPF